MVVFKWFSHVLARVISSLGVTEFGLFWIAFGIVLGGTLIILRGSD